MQHDSHEVQSFLYTLKCEKNKICNKNVRIGLVLFHRHFVFETKEKIIVLIACWVCLKVHYETISLEMVP